MTISRMGMLPGLFCAYVWWTPKAAGQCTPFSPPTECPTALPLACPDDATGDFCDADGWFVRLHPI